MKFRRTKAAIAGIVCAFSMLLANGTARADGGTSGGSMVVFDPTINATVVMPVVEIRQRCENDAQFVTVNIQTCTQVASVTTP